MPKAVPDSPRTLSTSDIYEKESINSGSTNGNGETKKRKSNLKRSLTINISPILSRLRKINKPASQPKEGIHLRPTRNDPEELRKRQYEEKLYELEKKAQKQLHLFDQRVQIETVTDSPLKLSSLHRYDSTYADLTLAKRVLQTPNRVKISYKPMLVAESPIKLFHENMIEKPQSMHQYQPSHDSHHPQLNHDAHHFQSSHQSQPSHQSHQSQHSQQSHHSQPSQHAQPPQIAQSFHLNYQHYSNNHQLSQQQQQQPTPAQTMDRKKAATIKRYFSLNAAVTPQHIIHSQQIQFNSTKHQIKNIEQPPPTKTAKTTSFLKLSKQPKNMVSPVIYE